MAAVFGYKTAVVFFISLFTLLSNCEANDIIGCGGFVKSHVSLDYSKIEIGLYTKEGSLKEKTECAPTNGYYFLPLYEKGEYILKVHPPPGWSFEPSKVNLVVDGSTDQCSTGQDINFAFNGFGITGKVVTNGQSQGPSGISVHLVSEKGDVRETLTGAGGEFHFTPVIPGKYTIKAAHPRWKLEPSQAVVHVKEGNTVLPVGSLAVRGYDVSGTVNSYGNPVAGLHVLLYSKEENPKYRVEGCKTALLQGVPDAPICYSVTDGTGEFRFGLVPAGQYRLVALAQPPGQSLVRYNVRPDHVPFTVLHDSLFIGNAFEVVGYTVSGRVVSAGGDAAGGGRPVGGVRVSLDGAAVAVTDAAGRYTLAALRPALYTVSFQHEQCEVEDVKLSISAGGAVTLQDARVAKWKVCGAVTPSDARDVTLSADRGGLVKTVSISPENNGKWCTFLPAGTYTARVHVTETERRDGLQFYPVTQKVSVRDGPVDDVTFSQLYATVSGEVRCLAPPCDGIEVTLAGEGAPDALVTTRTDKDGRYKFEGVLPGGVEVRVDTDRLCWRAARHALRVTSSTATVPHFHHDGYPLMIRSNYDVDVEYVSASGKERGVASVTGGESRVCVPTADRYTLTPRSCHLHEPPAVHADTRSPHTVILTAVAHSNVIKVISPERVDDLLLKINTNDKGSKDVGPLTPEPLGADFLYKHELFLAEGEVVVVSATSSTLLFSPSAPQQVVGGAGCEGAALVLRARVGLVVRGRIVPPVAAATVTLTSAGGDVQLVQTTGADGTYSFGPLDASLQYTVTADKDEYVMTGGAAGGDILAHRLAHITVRLRDEAGGEPLQGALVSVSGGSYRRNQVSGADGSLRFTSLAPDQYYVKPLMKEYRFTPPHHLVDVLEGSSTPLTLTGRRVAWSCSGTLTSLGGVGWARALLSAVPQRAAAAASGDVTTSACRAEDALTEPDGTFRIRGLLPECVYELQLKETPDLPRLRLAAAPPTVQVSDRRDVTGMRLLGIQPHHVTDASVWVHAATPEHYRTLRLTLSPEHAQQPLYSTSVHVQADTPRAGALHVLPRLQADNATYLLALHSTLSRATHHYADQQLRFVSDGQYKHFDIYFTAKVKSGEQELRQSSLLVVPVLALLVACYLRRDALLQRAGALLARPAAPPRARPAAAPPRPRPADLLDKASIDHILSTVNATGRRTKTKKAQ